jgi:hypothetical protein
MELADATKGENLNCEPCEGKIRLSFAKSLSEIERLEVILETTAFGVIKFPVPGATRS